MSNENDCITNKICETLLKATEKDGVDLLRNAVEQLRKALDSIECSLWYVNANVHKHGDAVNNTEKNTTSLICRNMAYHVGYIFAKPTDFVHSLNAGLFSQVIAICDKCNELPEYVPCNRKQVEDYNYLSLDFLKYLDREGLSPNDFIVIPIVSQINNRAIIAILELCFTSTPYSEDEWAEMAKIIRPFFSSAFNRYAMISKHKLMADLVSKHQEKHNYSTTEVFKHTVDVLLDQKKNYFPCESASFFIWDTYDFRYNLVYTTAAIDAEAMKNIFYQRGDGIVGQVAANNRPEIIEIITPEYKDNNSLFLEGVDNPQTAIVIPIPRISSDGDVVGVLQLINKKNSNGPDDLIDYFSELDLDIIRSIEIYLALTIECFIKEEEQRNFIDKLSHELMTPARSIRNDAERIIRKREDRGFNTFHLYSYMEDILSLSETQIWQVKTNLFQIRNPENRKSKYKIEKAFLSTLLRNGKDAVKPIAREYGVRMDSIVYTDNRTIIIVDEEAFVTVFYNLFTNAIKYHEKSRPFFVKAFYRLTGDGIEIDVEDNGVGIDEREKDNIFHMGFRGANVIRFNADGFGVGLTTVKQIIEDFGGRIEVTNLKQPTRFTIYLPQNIIHNE